MLGGFWRLYRGVAIVVFTLELALGLWLALGATGASEQVDDRFRRPATPVATGTSIPTGTPAPASVARVTIEVQETDVNAALATQAGGAPGVKDVAVRLDDGSVVITARLSDPVPASVEATGTLAASGGRIRLLIDEANAGPIPLPRQAVDLLENRANAALEALPGLDNLYVEKVEVLAGKARITARPASLN